jgi:eukaryotic-like serine/threonine-protein kinase
MAMADKPFDEEAVFNAARQIVVPVERDKYLHAACHHDDAAIRRIQALLAAFQEASGFLQLPAFTSTTNEDRTSTALEPFGGTGAVIADKYTLIEKLGEGGMGEVWVAQQSAPVKRQVALKLIKAGMDSKSVLQRFEQERQALAVLDHPHIAKVFDGGVFFLPGQQAWAGWGGSPFFVMELAQGQTLTAFCDEAKLTLQERLELFILICQAVQHAHHKGIVHRDLKPSNILVTLVDGRPVPKIIDFGIAKAVEQKLTAQTLHTALGQMIGTPTYMSPEQAEFGSLDVDTRSDIFSLGVILYELLTGTTPLDVTRLQTAGFAELQRLIREEETPRPSTRLSVLGESAAVVAGNRHTNVKQLTQLLAGDLDWIVLKAMEKDRNRRYDSPGSFAADITRYLRHEAILARPLSIVYKLRKFVRRNQAMVGTVLAVALALVAGTAIATWQAIVATVAKDEALNAAVAEKQAKEMAQTREAETRAVLEFVEEYIFARARPEGQDGGLGRTVTLRQAVDAALPYVEKSFPDQPLIEARLRQSLGTSFFYLGEAKTAADQAETARRLYAQHLGPEHLDTLRSMANLANALDAQGQLQEALVLRERVWALLKVKLGPDHPFTLQNMSHLAISYANVGRYTEALALREQTQALMEVKLGPDHPTTLRGYGYLASIYRAMGRFDEVNKILVAIVPRLQAKLGPNHPDTLSAIGNLAINHEDLGRYGEALQLREKLLALHQDKLGPQHVNTLTSMMNLAVSRFRAGQLKESQALMEEALALQKKHLGADHPLTLRCMSSLSVIYPQLQRYAEALQLRKDVLDLRRAKLGPGQPETLDSMWGLTDILCAMNRSAEAMPVIDEFLKQAPGTVAAPRLMPEMLDMRLRHFALLRDVNACRQTAEIWEKLGRTDAASLLIAARMRCVTAIVQNTASGADAKRHAVEEADRALHWVQMAVAAGHTNAKELKEDPDLAVLRRHRVFQKLLADLEAGTKDKDDRP